MMDPRVKPAHDGLARNGDPRIRPMNSPTRVIGLVNAAHLIDHYSMLIFAAVVIVMGPALGMAYSELLPYATPGFVAFGAYADRLGREMGLNGVWGNLGVASSALVTGVVGQ